MGEADFAALPAELAVWEVRFRVARPGRRVMLVTTLTDAGRDPTATLAGVYERRLAHTRRIRRRTVGRDWDRPGAP
jgi:hypothetical protein